MLISRLLIINSFLLVFLMSSCYEKQEGCLDIIATNFDFAADLPCEDCCEYPQLRILINHAMDTLAFKTGVPLEIGEGQTVQFEEIIYFFSKIYLRSTSGNLHTVEEVIRIIDHDQEDNLFLVPDNFVRIAYPKFNFLIGTFRNIGAYDQLQFNLGIDARIQLEESDSDHPLYPNEDSLYLGENEGYINARFVIQTDTSQEKLDTFVIAGPDMAIFNELPMNIEFQGSQDLIIEVVANYLKWFEGVNFKAQSQEEVTNIIKMNTDQVFSIY